MRDYLLHTIRRVRLKAYGFVSLDTLGKIALLSIVIWAMFEWLGNWWTSAIAVAALLGIGGLLRYGCLHGWYRRHLFRLDFPNEWPVTPTAPRSRCKTVTLGESSVLVEIAVKTSTYISHFDVRFLTGAGGGNVDPNIIKVTGVKDKSRGMEFVIQQDPRSIPGMLMVPHEAAGAVDCYYNPPCHIDAARSLSLVISFQTERSWSGWLGFRGRDKNGEKAPPSHARFIVQEPQAPACAVYPTWQ